MDIKITPKRIIAFYFLAPYVLGVLLADGLGIDISGIMKQTFGLLQSIELSGESIDVKAMSLMWVLLLNPLIFWMLLKPAIDKNGIHTFSRAVWGLRQDDTSRLQLLFLILVTSFAITVFGHLYIVGLDIVEYLQGRSYINPGMRLVLTVCSSDFLFSLFSTVTAMCVNAIIISIPAFFYALFLSFTSSEW